jgi:tetratricopeptide (TPR) repeat protein
MTENKERPKSVRPKSVRFSLQETVQIIDRSSESKSKESNDSDGGMLATLSAAFKSVFSSGVKSSDSPPATVDAKPPIGSGSGEYHKNKGNEHFKQGSFSDAIRHYTAAIELNEDSHVIRSNRSACYHQTGQYQEALHDARIAILKAPGWYKGYCRKAASHVALGEFTEARREYAAAQQLEPSDPLVKQALAEVNFNPLKLGVLIPACSISSFRNIRP